MDTDQSLDPQLGGTSRITPFTSELNNILDSIRSVNPDSLDTWGAENAYFEMIDSLMEGIDTYQASNQEILNFLHLIRYLYSSDQVDPNTELFRQNLLMEILYEFRVFYHKELIRERISSILVKLFTESNPAFLVAIEVQGNIGNLNGMPIAEITKDNDEVQNFAIHQYLGSLLHEAFRLRGIV